MSAPPSSVQVVTNAVAASACVRWRAAIESCAASMVPGDADFQPTSGSIRLRALGAAWFEELQGTVAPVIAAHLGPRMFCLTSQCWARRQFPPALRPPGQHPHAWHQDGALGSRFDDHAALLPMRTVWITLDHCGIDAPSLEWIEASTTELLHPLQLTDESLAQRHGTAPRRHAQLRAGDALVFDGALVHRTFVRPTMDRLRVSVELRFVETAMSPLA